MYIVTVEVILDKSDIPYIIIPCTFHPNIVMGFRMVVELLELMSGTGSSRTRIDKVLQLVPCNSEWRKKCVQGYWTTDFRGGCINESTWLQNPQFALTISEDSNVAVVLTQILPDNVIGMYLIKTDEAKMITEAPTEFEFFEASPFPKRSYETSLQFKLKAGIYIIVCCTFEAGQSGDFELTIYAENDEMEMDFIPVGDDLSFVKQKLNKLKVSITFLRFYY